MTYSIDFSLFPFLYSLLKCESIKCLSFSKHYKKCQDKKGPDDDTPKEQFSAELQFSVNFKTHFKSSTENNNFVLKLSP